MKIRRKKLAQQRKNKGKRKQQKTHIEFVLYTIQAPAE